MCEQCGCNHDKAQDTFEQKVKMIIDSIRPNLQSHGGDVEFVASEKGSTVKVRLQGTAQAARHENDPQNGHRTTPERKNTTGQRSHRG